MGVVHHAAYLPWLEEARVAYLRAIGHPYAEVRAGGIDIAVIEVVVRYLVPARFDDEVEIAVTLGVATAARFPITYVLRRGDDTIATATTTHACLDAATGRPVRVPDWLRAR